MEKEEKKQMISLPAVMFLATAMLGLPRRKQRNRCRMSPRWVGMDRLVRDLAEQLE
jgi:hypothetical protein